jgi:hypothetical protein
MPEKAKRPRWIKRLLIGLLVLLVLGLVFYQPIIFSVAQLAAREVGRSQAFSLRFKIHGSIISSLYIEDLHLEPLPENTKLPLERVDAKRIALRYNLLNLLQKNYLKVIELVELKSVDLVVRPTAPGPPPQKNPAGLRIPIILPEKIDIQDVNLMVRNPGGDLEVKQLGLQFEQGTVGHLGCGALRIPPLGGWNNIQAGLRYENSKL